MSHEYPPPEARPLREVREAGGVIQVEVADEDNVHFAGVDAVEEGEAGHAVVARVDAAVEEDGRGAEGQEVAGAAYFLAGAEGGYGHYVFHCGADVVLYFD
mmetsp:Transcript_30698/g.64073  ORF Transcript_30698/g.64073 Transcript_30698/m.64073 type:complete len:101 (+) Transcript_30698:34-336(+)